jgi:uncharacterized RDD family membrane protein YckC
MDQPTLPFPPPPVPAAPGAWREARPAAVGVRSAAAGVNALLVLAGLGVFLLTFHLLGGEITLERKAAPGWIAAAVVLGLFYHIYWCLLKRDAPGMRWFRLRLVNFDGYEPEPGQRVVRLIAACLSLLACGLGLLWALFDEEGLTWHDHISKTYPTLEPSPRRLPRRR